MSKKEKVVAYQTESFWERNKKSEGYLLQKRVKAVAVSVLRAILLFGMCFLILQPILNKISVSFMMEDDLYNPLIISIPEHFTIENYQLANELMDYWKTLLSTLIISVTIAVVQVAACTLVGYGFARYDFPLKKFWFACIIMMIVVPPQTISTSLFLRFKFFDIFGIIKLITGHTIQLTNSVLPYYLMSAGCMGLKNGLYIYLIRQYFRNIPNDIEEAAYVDGCGTLRTFLQIMLPDATPIITSCFLFSFVWQWTDSFYSGLFLGNTKLLSIQLGRLAERVNQWVVRVKQIPTGASVGFTQCMISTGTLMVIIPLLIVYLYAQKSFVESIASSGIKM